MHQILLAVAGGPTWAGTFWQALTVIYGIMMFIFFMYALIKITRILLFLDVKGVRMLSLEESRKLSES